MEAPVRELPGSLTTEWLSRVAMRCYSKFADASHELEGQATKGVWWMPWRWKAMKDVVSCDKPRLAAASVYPGMSEWGNPAGVMSRHPLLNT